MLLVICVTDRMARWSARPIGIGHPGWDLVPVVLGPDRVPLVTQATQARQAPELAVLSALAHEVVAVALPRADQRYLEALMTTQTFEPQTPFIRRYWAQGRAEGEARGEVRGEAKTLLVVLEARGFKVTDDFRERITECTDLDQMETWARRAVTAPTIDDVFD